jgi:hypothetical protein
VLSFGDLRFNPELNTFCDMKRQNCHVGGMLIIALACFIFSGFQTSKASGSTAFTAATSKNAGHLIIRRAANFGSRLTLNISIDGSHVAALVRGQSYDGSLSPGEHVISLTVTPRRSRFGTTTKHLTVQAGQTYGFTAIWSHQHVVLR